MLIREGYEPEKDEFSGNTFSDVNNSVPQMVKATVDNPMTEEEIEQYMGTFYKYNNYNLGDIRIHHHKAVVGKPGFAAIIWQMIIFAIYGILGMLLATVGITTWFLEWDIHPMTKIAMFIGLCLAGSTFVGGMNRILRNINDNIRSISAHRHLKVGNIYWYDPDCLAQSKIMYDPIQVQVLDVVKNRIVVVDCISRRVHTVTDPNLLIPVTDKSAVGECFVRLPVCLPLIHPSDLETIDASIINAKNNNQSVLRDNLIELRAKLYKYGSDPVCREIHEKYNASIELINSSIEFVKWLESENKSDG